MRLKTFSVVGTYGSLSGAQREKLSEILVWLKGAGDWELRTTSASGVTDEAMEAWNRLGGDFFVHAAGWVKLRLDRYTCFSDKDFSELAAFVSRANSFEQFKPMVAASNVLVAFSPGLTNPDYPIVQGLIAYAIRERLLPVVVVEESGEVVGDWLTPELVELIQSVRGKLSVGGLA